MPDVRFRTTSRGDTTMRFMNPLKPNEDTDAGVLPDEKILTARVKAYGAKRAVTDGPFAEAKELIAGTAAKR